MLRSRKVMPCHVRRLVPCSVRRHVPCSVRLGSTRLSLRREVGVGVVCYDASEWATGRLTAVDMHVPSGKTGRLPAPARLVDYQAVMCEE